MRKRRAVVIDDEEMIVDLFRDFFSTRDYTVLTYTRPVVCPVLGEKGTLCHAGYACADVIITDFEMPRTNGLELLQEQARNGCKLTSGNKAVMSGHLDEGNRRKIKQLGYAFFQKPIDFSELSAWLDECEKRMDLSKPLSSTRRETRHRTHYEVQCLVDRTDETVNGVTVDISNNGFCLKLAVPLIAGQTIHVRTTPALIACHIASVRWVNKNPDGSYLAGLSCH